MKTKCDQCGSAIDPPASESYGPVFCRAKCANLYFDQGTFPVLRSVPRRDEPDYKEMLGEDDLGE
jgi:hypothetical protein